MPVYCLKRKTPDFLLPTWKLSPTIVSPDICLWYTPLVGSGIKISSNSESCHWGTCSNSPNSLRLNPRVPVSGSMAMNRDILRAHDQDTSSTKAIREPDQNVMFLVWFAYSEDKDFHLTDKLYQNHRQTYSYYNCSVEI